MQFTQKLSLLNPGQNAFLLNSQALSVYHGIFIVAQLFQFALLYDAVVNSSMMQLLATLAFNVLSWIYTIMQYLQAVGLANLLQRDRLTIPPGLVVHPTTALEIILIVVMAGFCLGWLFVTKRLHSLFGWRIFRELGADVGLKSQLFMYHFYIMLLKIDVFFFLGFSFQFLILVSARQGDTLQLWSHALIATPLSIALLVISYYGVKRENKYMMYCTFAGLFALVIYLATKVRLLTQLVDMYGANFNTDKYAGSRNSLSLFGKFH